MKKTISDEAHRCIGNEIKNQNFDAACLSKALMESQGNHELAMSLYVKMRFEMIQNDVFKKEIRGKNLTNRKLRSVIPHSNAPLLNLPKTSYYEWIIVCICHVMVTFAFFGIIWVANIMLGKQYYIPTDIGVLVGMLTINLIPISAHIWIRLYFNHVPYQKIIFCYAVLLGFISFLMGVNLLR